MKQSEFLAILGLTLFFAVLPFVGVSEAKLYFLTFVGIWALFALSFDFVFGGLGMLSFGHAAYFGIGSYSVAMLTTLAKWSFIPSMFIGAVMGAIVAMLFSAIALRLAGLFFALVTLALAELAHDLALVRLRHWTGGFDGLTGIPRPDLFGFELIDNRMYYVWVVFILGLVVLGILMIRSSPFGQVLQAIKQNPVRAEQLGFALHPFKVAAFGISGFIASLSGGLLVSLLAFADPETLHWSTSGRVVLMTVLGGTGTLLGPIVGAFVFEILREVISGVTDRWQGGVGMIFVIFTIFVPNGLVGITHLAFSKWIRH
jgi:branched-chain amino acid transport system permease protein